MVFSSVLFTFVFLPIVLILYYLAKDKYRNILLLIASLLFYSIGEPKAIFLMIFSIIINYLFGLLIGKTTDKLHRKILLILSITINLGILFFFKYFDYSITVFNYLFRREIALFNITLPIGISFFTFQAISYLIDVYRKDAEADKNIMNIGLYISFFPQLIAGPIVRYNSISEQIKSRYINIEKFGRGATRFVSGFAKKVLLANNLSIVAESAFQYTDLSKMPVALAWLGSVAFSLQIFFDFSGYSDMAIGLGKMFGFDFEENFNYPYIAKSITDFWRRWHISLSQWFRDYVYIPLGGSRVGVKRQIINLLIVWTLTGLWHGADITFVAWGLMYFIVLIFEKFVLKPEVRQTLIRIIWRIITLLIINTGWILFNTESFHSAVQFMKSMICLNNNELINATTIGLIREYGFFMILGVLFSTPIVHRTSLTIEKNEFAKKIGCVMIPIGYILVFLWAISFLILGAHNPFIYFNF